MFKTLFACLGFTLFAFVSCNSAANRLEAKVGELRALRNAASDLSGESQKIEADRPGLFSYIFAGLVDGAAIASFGMPVGASAIPVQGDSKASSRQKEIVQQLRTMAKQEEVILAEVRAQFQTRRMWWWLAVVGLGASVWAWYQVGVIGKQLDLAERTRTAS